MAEIARFAVPRVYLFHELRQGLLEALPDLECSIMSRFYVRGQTVKAIAKDLGYSYGHVSRCKTEAIRRLREMGEGEVMRLLPIWYII